MPGSASGAPDVSLQRRNITSGAADLLSHQEICAQRFQSFYRVRPKLSSGGADAFIASGKNGLASLIFFLRLEKKAQAFQKCILAPKYARLEPQKRIPAHKYLRHGCVVRILADEEKHLGLRKRIPVHGCTHLGRMERILDDT